MSRFKTELCNNLIELGSCKYGDRCHYAHGAHELRQVSRRHPKYRTERCKNFELTGKCPFGPRCSYVHPKPDLDSMIDQLSNYMKFTKAPKPDSEDDDDYTNSIGISRTNTTTTINTINATSSSASLCGDPVTLNEDDDDVMSDDILGYKFRSDLKNDDDHHIHTNLNGDENKENHLVLNHLKQPSAIGQEKKLSQQFVNQPMLFNTNPTIVKRNNSPLSPISEISKNNQDVNVSFQAHSSSSSFRAPLNSNHNANILTPLTVSSNFQFKSQSHIVNSNTQHQCQANDQINSNNGLAFNHSALFDSSTYECHKKPRLSISSSSNRSASNPFGISNPLSDYFNSSKIGGRRSPPKPKKQFYTRF